MNWYGRPRLKAKETHLALPGHWHQGEGDVAVGGVRIGGSLKDTFINDFVVGVRAPRCVI